jgi:thiol-disulfide isomerase/thioredoxin
MVTMLQTLRVVGAMVIGLAVAGSIAEGAEPKPADTLDVLKREQEAAWAELDEGRKPGTTEAEKQRAVDRYYERVSALGRRALALAAKDPAAPQSVEAVLWAHSATTEDDTKLADDIYEWMEKHSLDSDAILPACRLAWLGAIKSARAETFLRAAVDGSKNSKVRALCCYSLARYQEILFELARDLRDPVRGPILRRNLERLGPSVNRRLEALDAARLEGDARAFYARTIREFGELQPMGKDYAPLGEQARGRLFQMDHLSIGRPVPEAEGEDIDGRPMKLSDFRGKVVVISFWATWCGPCMGLVPKEKALVEKMKGRPFALVGVNGDDDRAKVKEVSAREGITWRSFWNGGRLEGIPVKWGVSGWPTIYIVDANGLIRDDGLVYIDELFRGNHPDKLIETLVSEAEAASKR